MTDTRRDQIIEIIKREFIGPDPLDLPGYRQENGEEILIGDPPGVRYLAGVLYPQDAKDIEEEVLNPDLDIDVTQEEECESKSDQKRKSIGSTYEYLEDFEEVMDLSNAYRPSAMSITVAIKDGDSIRTHVKAGIYHKSKTILPGRVDETVIYSRQQIFWDNSQLAVPLPAFKAVRLDVDDNGSPTGLQLVITPRGSITEEDRRIVTFSLVNEKISETGYAKDEDCFFQCGFSLESERGFSDLPDRSRVTYDEDYHSSRLLYRGVKDYGIGHGCSAVWAETEAGIFQVKTETFPVYETIPIIPANIDGVSLSMHKMSSIESSDEVLEELREFCDGYANWILGLKQQIIEVDDQVTAQRHINNCEECLERMKRGVHLLASDGHIMQAFQLMNRAMLLQQLHYGLPLREWTADSDGKLVISDNIVNPVISDQTTWHGNPERYGKWRAFQLAFILMNLEGMTDKDSPERNLVDLIWFPTGGGKTEAYLGLSSFAIFMGRLTNPQDYGTVILMRYTLRLLTTQQYERAASMICACERIRQENAELLGESRISIGLWVGGDTTPNKMNDAVRKYERLLSEHNEENPFVILKCPWCGAQMGPVRPDNRKRSLQGYKKIVGRHRKQKFVFQCSNKDCYFSENNNPLPLSVIDEEIYESPPTLLLGTVDKFAMLPYRPEAKALFGFRPDGSRFTSPDLIIQDELHLISGPLGSMVGHYETMIQELCTDYRTEKPIRPKIIASTATISRAKEQCHALYACGPENVKQFPPQGFDAGDSYFAKEMAELAGRRYVGIFASGSSSPATTMIRLYATLLYAAKAIHVEEKALRDPYWTNIGYFNSIRELGQTATWIRQDIEEYLHVIYKRRFETKNPNYRKERRYIYRDEELTSRIRGDQIPASLQNLSVRYPSETPRPVDICLATNMISVGIDLPRLGLMTVAGQPKTTSEYIQATSRVGRASTAPGLIFTFLNPSKPRDRSHYEHFQSYHSKMYSFVEPTSVTPFASPLRGRALHAVVIGLIRFLGGERFGTDPPTVPDDMIVQRVRRIIEDRILRVEPEEAENTMEEFDEIIERWKDWAPGKFADFTNNDIIPLMYPSGSTPNALWGGRGFPTPTSLRSVDASCEIRGLSAKYTPKEF